MVKSSTDPNNMAKKGAGGGGMPDSKMEPKSKRANNLVG